MDHEGGAFLGLSDHISGLFQIVVPKSNGLDMRANTDIITITEKSIDPINPVLEDSMLVLIVLNIISINTLPSDLL